LAEVKVTGGLEVPEIPQKIKKSALSRDLKPTIRVGKSGLTNNLISEIKDQLSNKELVKVKINRGLFDKRDLGDVWAHLANTTESVLVSARGNVGVLWKQ
tara:strand:- start:637 stop:936 length:300 start_codon:yes stop_codon:yes gene_type:complete